MSDSNDLIVQELDGVKRVLETFRAEGTKTLNTLVAYEEQCKKNIADIERKRAEDLERHIADLKVKGVIKTNDEAAKLAEAELSRYASDKLKSEIEILKTISKANQEERDREYKRLETEKSIIELKNKGDKASLKQAQQLAKDQKKRDAEDKKKKKTQEKAQELETYTFGDKFSEQFGDAIAELSAVLDNPKAAAAQMGEEALLSAMKGVGKAISDGLNAINNAISSYAQYQTSINARLQGVSSFSDVTKTLGDIAFSPLFRAEDLYSNLSELVSQGIVTNVEQRAMFMTVKDGIAQTFDVTSDSLKRIIRIQRNDSTAARLGMEGYLNKFLNVYVENTEYLTTTFDSVASSLFEASAMLGNAKASAEFEYIVQKWLGTLTGVGLSESTAQEIATALGQLGSGDVESLSGSNMQNLLVMAANKANLSYSDLLVQGLNSTDTNKLLLGMTEYLQEIANQSTNVVKNQLAKIFGVTISDLVAVSNLEQKNLRTIYDDMLSYQGMYDELGDQFSQLTSRVGIANILENLFANLNYQSGMSIAANPILYATWKITDLIQGVTGGINIPAISVMGNGFDLNATVENLIKLGVVGVSTLGNIGKIASGLSSIGSGKVLLNKLGVEAGNAEIKTFGSGFGGGAGRSTGSATSASTYIGNTDSENYSESTINKNEDESQKKLDKKKEESKNEDPMLQLLLYITEEVKLKDKMQILSSKASRSTSLLEAFVRYQLGSYFADFGLDEDESSSESGTSSGGAGTEVAKDKTQPVTLSDGTILDSISAVVQNNATAYLDEEYQENIFSYLGKIEELGSSIYTYLTENNVGISQTESVSSEINNTELDRTSEITHQEEETIVKEVEKSNTHVAGSQLESSSNYLSEINFANNFELLVKDVERIADKLAPLHASPNNTPFIEDDTPISGLTQFTF